MLPLVELMEQKFGQITEIPDRFYANHFADMES
jgi:hypothetical protein